MVKSKRLFVGEFETKQVRVGSKKLQHGKLFLFNDTLIVTHSKNKERYKVFEEINLTTEAFIQDSVNTFKYHAVSFELHSPKTKLIIVTNSTSDKEYTKDKIETIVQYYNLKVKVFGLPLHDMLERENLKTGIPSIVQRIVNILEQST